MEKDPCARRVVEHHFPGSVHYPDIAEVEEKEVIAWSLTYGQVEMVIIGAGPPCQGVSGLNSQRGREILFIHPCHTSETPGTEAFPLGSGAHPYGKRGIHGRGGQGHHVTIFRGHPLGLRCWNSDLVQSSTSVLDHLGA